MDNALTVMAVLIMHFHLLSGGMPLRIPPEVSKAFSTQFPTAHLKKWQQGNGEYIATFRQNGKKYVAYYTSGGIWKATESSVKWTRSLPKPVRIGWDHCKYMDWLILDMKKIEKPVETLYAIHVGQVQSLGPDDSDIGSEYLLYFSEKGELVKEERKS